jgi:hypothetical protein
VTSEHDAPEVGQIDALHRHRVDDPPAVSMGA